MAMILIEGPSVLPQYIQLRQLLFDKLRERTGSVSVCQPVPADAFPTPVPTMHRLLRPLLDYAPDGSDGSMLLDGWHLAEMVEAWRRYYGALDKVAHAPEQLLYLKLFLQSRGALTTALLPSIDAIVANCPNSDTADEAVEQAQAFYNLVSTVPWLADTLDDLLWPQLRLLGPNELNRRAEQLVTRACNAYVPAPGFVTYVGPAAPEVLLLGERRTTADKREPAFVPWAEGSGAWLLRAVLQSSFSKLVGIANACDVDDPHKLWEQLGQPEHVIALGAPAGRQLTRLHIPHATVPHPVYMRRFHYRQIKAYAGLLDRSVIEPADRLAWRP